MFLKENKNYGRLAALIAEDSGMRFLRTQDFLKETLQGQSFSDRKRLVRSCRLFCTCPKLKPAAVILEDATEQILYTFNDKTVLLTLPKIVFG